MLPLTFMDVDWFEVTERMRRDRDHAKSKTCEICKKFFISNTRGMRRKCRDHDHKSGRLRGTICAECNLILGRIENTNGYTKRVVSYLAGQGKSRALRTVVYLAMYRLMDEKNVP